MSATDDYLEALYKEGIRIRDEWFATYVANLNVLGRTLGTSQQFIADMRHLMPPPRPQQAPLASEPMASPAQEEMAPRAMPSGPPPLPEEWRGNFPPPPSGYSDEEAFEQRVAASREAARDMQPGLDGVLGGRR